MADWAEKGLMNQNLEGNGVSLKNVKTNQDERNTAEANEGF